MDGRKDYSREIHRSTIVRYDGGVGWGKILLGILALLRRQNSGILENSDFFKY